MSSTTKKLGYGDYLCNEEKRSEPTENQTVLIICRSNILETNLWRINNESGNSSYKTIEKDPLSGKIFFKNTFRTYLRSLINPLRQNKRSTFHSIKAYQSRDVTNCLIGERKKHSGATGQ